MVWAGQFIVDEHRDAQIDKKRIFLLWLVATAPTI
jgi:hypothetical protein